MTFAFAIMIKWWGGGGAIIWEKFTFGSRGTRCVQVNSSVLRYRGSNEERKRCTVTPCAATFQCVKCQSVYFPPTHTHPTPTPRSYNPRNPPQSGPQEHRQGFSCKQCRRAAHSVSAITEESRRERTRQTVSLGWEKLRTCSHMWGRKWIPSGQRRDDSSETMTTTAKKKSIYLSIDAKNGALQMQDGQAEIHLLRHHLP